MLTHTVDRAKLLAVSARLGDAAIEPGLWPEIMQEISVAVGAVGAALLQSDVRTPDVPRAPGVAEMFGRYFSEGWYARDIRADRGAPLLLGGEKVIIDQDILTPEEINTSALYNELVGPHGLKWWAAVGLRAGSAHWALSIQRTVRQGPFERSDKRVLAELSDRLTETATLSQAVSRVTLSDVTNALQLIKHAALAVDRSGFVLEMNAQAEQLFDDDFRVRHRRLFVRDVRAKLALDAFLDQLHATPDTAALPAAPIVVRREARKQPLVIRILPVDGAARSPFLGARALLILCDLGHKSNPQTALLAQTFGLSRAEARLTSLIVGGASLERAAEDLGVSQQTARNQLKAVFAKTGTHRQGELIALLARL